MGDFLLWRGRMAGHDRFDRLPSGVGQGGQPVDARSAGTLGLVRWVSNAFPGRHVRPLPALVMAALFLVVGPLPVRADYAGVLSDITSATHWDLTLGDSLYFDVTVQNTGSDPWTSVTYDPWAVQVPAAGTSWGSATTLWLPGGQVAAGATATLPCSLSPAYLPTTPGQYSFNVQGYHPADGLDSGNYAEMAGSPRTISFTLYAPNNKAWVGRAGSLQWGDAGNFAPEGLPDETTTVTFTSAGLAPNDAVILGADRKVDRLVIDSGLDFSIGGPGGTLTLQSGALSRTAASAGTQVIARDVALGADAVWDISGTGQLAVSGAISGDHTLTKTGSGTLRLSGASTYTGTTTLQAGTFLIGGDVPSGAPGPLGNSTSPITVAGGYGGAWLLIDGPYTVGRPVSVKMGSTITLGCTNTSGTAVFAGSITAVSSTRVAVPAGGTLALSNYVSGPLTLVGEGTVRLTDRCYTYYGGKVTVNSGTLLLDRPEHWPFWDELVIGDGVGSDLVRLLRPSQMQGVIVTVNSSGVLDLNGQNDSIEELVVQGGRVTTGGGTLTCAYSVTMTDGVVEGNLSTSSLAWSNGQIGGGTLSVSDSLTLNASVLPKIIDFPLAFSGSEAIQFTVPAGSIPGGEDVVVTSSLSGPGGFDKTGSGTLVIAGEAPVTYTGPTEVSNGTLVWRRPASAGVILGPLSVSTGTFRLEAGASIDENAEVWVSGSSGAIYLNSSVQTIGSLAGSGKLYADTAALTVGGNNKTTSFSGVLFGTEGLVKKGTRTLTLSGANPFTGPIVINGGALGESSLYALGGAGGGTPGNIRMAGGVLELGYANFTRPLGTGPGMVDLSGPGGGGFSAVNADHTVNLGGSQAQVVWGTGHFVADGEPLLFGSLTASKLLKFLNPIELGAAPREIRVEHSTFSKGAEIAGAISGTGGILKTGDGLLLLSGDNTYKGTTTIAGGSLRGLSPYAFGGADGTTPANLRMAGGTLAVIGTFTMPLGNGPGTLDMSGPGGGGFGGAGSPAVINLGGAGAPVAWGSGFFVADGQPLLLGSPEYGFKAILANPIALGSADREINVINSSSSGELSGVISGSGGIVRTGRGDLWLTGANTYTGPTVIRQASVHVTADVAAGVPGPLGNSTSPIVIGDTAGSGFARLDLSNTGTTCARPIVTQAGGTGDIDLGSQTANATVTFSGDILANRNICPMAGTGGTAIFTGTISGSGGVYMQGWPGTVVLAHANSYSGPTSVGYGTLRLGAAGALPAASDLTVDSTSNLDLNGFDQTVRSLTMSSGSIRNTSATAATLQLGGTPRMVVLNNASIGPDVGTSLILDLGGVSRDFYVSLGTGTVSAAITNGTLSKTGSGTLALAGPSTYAGGTTVQAGTLALLADAPESAPGSLGQTASAVLLGDTRGEASATLVTAAGGVTVGRPVTVQVGGTGALTLGGAQTSGDSSFAGAVTLNRDVTLTSAGGTVSFTGPISGTGGVTKSGTGTVALAGTNTYAGNTTIADGALRATYGQGWPTDTRIITTTGGVLELLADFTGSLGTGPGNVDLRGSGAYWGGFSAYGGMRTVNLGGSGAAVPWGTCLGSHLIFGSSTADSLLVFANGIDLGTGLGTLQVNDNPDSTGDYAEIPGVISGTSATASLTVPGPGRLVLSGANTYAATTRLTGGTLTLGSDSAAGCGPVGIGTLSLGTATLETTAATQTLNNPIKLDGNTTLGPSGGNTLILTGPVQVTGTRTLTINITTQIQGAISGTYGLTVNGTGTLMLSGASTCSGQITISVPTLHVGSDSGAGFGPFGTGTVDLKGTLIPDDADRVLANAFNFNGNTTFGQVGGQSLTFTGAVVPSAGRTMTVNSTTRWAGIVSNSSTSKLTKDGPGTLVLGGGSADAAANTCAESLTVAAGTVILDKQTGTAAWHGSLTVSGGTVRLNQASQIPDGETVTVTSGTMDFNNQPETISSLTYQGGATTNVANPLTLASTGTALTLRDMPIPFDVSLTGATGGTVSFDAANNGTATLSGGVNMGSVNRTFSVADGTAPVDMQILGVISGSGGLTKSGSGTLGFGNSGNNYTGPTTVSSGTLQLLVASAVPDSSAVTVSSGAALNLAGLNKTVASITGYGAVALGSGTLTVGDGTSTTFSGPISGSGAGLTKTGSGTLTLSGANTYSGATTLQAGTLTLSAGSTASSAFSVSPGATLNFSGGMHNLGGATFTNTGTINFSGATTSFASPTTLPGTVNFSGGTIGGTAEVTFSNLNWTGGAISNSGGVTIPVGGTLAISGSSRMLSGGKLNVAGTATFTGTGTVYTGSTSAPVTLSVPAGGVFDIQGDGSFGWLYTGSMGMIDNAGLFKKSGGDSTSYVSSGWKFNNTGAVEVRSGTLSLTSAVTQLSGSTLTGGTWAVYANSTLTISTGTNITTNQGTVILSGEGSTFARINSLANNQGSFSILGGRAFTSAGALANSGTVVVGPTSTLTVNGNYTQTAGMTTVNGTLKATGGQAYINGGLLELDTDAGAGGAVLTLNLGSGSANLGATQHLAALNATSGIAALMGGHAKVLLTKALAVNPAAARIDLADNAMIVDYPGGTPETPSPTLENVKQWLAAGYNTLTWTGNGIVSSAAAADPITYGLGYAQNDMLFLPYEVFSGEPVDLSTVLVKFTYNGDVNLDGCVDDNDVTFINLFYDGGITTSHYWNEGDIFGYDGRIDDNDVTFLGLTYGAGWLWGEPLGIGGPLGTVPEPATLALAALGGLGVLLRRK